jgi:hypothetical protein
MGLIAGCGGGGGESEAPREFEKPAVQPPPVKEKPIPVKELSPRERRALDKKD